MHDRQWMGTSGWVQSLKLHGCGKSRDISKHCKHHTGYDQYASKQHAGPGAVALLWVMNLSAPGLEGVIFSMPAIAKQYLM
jgi:hypothetical protein